MSLHEQTSSNLVFSLFQELTLQQYVTARMYHCTHTHQQPCETCSGMLKVANLILQEGYTTLGVAFKLASPAVTYTAERAKRKLLQMPHMCILIGEPSQGNSQYILMEHVLGANDFKLNVVVNALSCTAQKSLPNFDKSCVKMLLSLVQSEREKAYLKYAVCKASNLSATKARKLYGFENMGETFSKVEEAIVETESIREAIDELANVEDRAMLASFGIEDDLSSDSDVDILDEFESSDSSSCQVSSEARTKVICALKENDCNWFAVIEALQSVAESDGVEIISQNVFSELTHMDCNLFSSSEKILLKESKEAFDCAQRDGYDQDRISRVLNDEIVTDSESDNPDSYCGMRNILSESGKQLIQRKCKRFVDVRKGCCRKLLLKKDSYLVEYHHV